MSITSSAVGLYNRSPYPAKVAMAAVRGWKIKRSRYTGESEALTRAALERDRYSADEWAAWQADRLGLILRRAATLVPHYRQAWADAGADIGEVAAASSLTAWPTLAKDLIRDDPLRFVADDRPLRTLDRVGTSGTSGTPLVIHRRRDDTARHYAIYEARVRRWNGVSRHEPWAMMGGQLVAPFERQTPPFWVYSPPLHQLYLSTNHLKPANASAFAEELQRFRPTHLVGYPSSMTLLAQMALDQQLELPTLAAVIGNAEPLLAGQRDVLRVAFGCEPRNTYGMSEGAASAAECAHGSLHVSPDNGVIEIVDDEGAPVPAGSPGEVVVTGLVNESMILVRYRTGDRAVLAAAPCGCGVAAPVIERIEGRTSDLIRTPDGRQVFWLNPAFAGLPIRESQVVQPVIDRLTVRVVAAPEWRDEDADTLRRRLAERVGHEMVIEIETVDEIERGPNGKFRPVISLAG